MIAVTVFRDRAMRAARSMRWRTCAGDEACANISARDVLEHRAEIKLLLILPAQRVTGLLPDDGEDRLVVHQRIIETGRQVRGTRPRCRNTGAKPSREFGVGAQAMKAAISSWRA
jgi:hypothetical protein